MKNYSGIKNKWKTETGEINSSAFVWDKFSKKKLFGGYGNNSLKLNRNYEKSISSNVELNITKVAKFVKVFFPKISEKSTEK